MSYSYQEREREWDEYVRPSDRSYTVRRYVVSEDPPAERERDLVIRRRTDEFRDYERDRMEQTLLTSLLCAYGG